MRGDGTLGDPTQRWGRGLGDGGAGAHREVLAPLQGVAGVAARLGQGAQET